MTSETGDSGASSRYGIPMISSRRVSSRRDRIQRETLLLYPAIYTYVPEITLHPWVGWFISSVSAEAPWIRLESRLSLLTFRHNSHRVSLSYISPSFVEYIVRLRTICVYIHLGRYMPHRLAALLEAVVLTCRVFRWTRLTNSFGKKKSCGSNWMVTLISSS